MIPGDHSPEDDLSRWDLGDTSAQGDGARLRSRPDGHDRDQDAADRDQAASDQDQAASDRDLARGLGHADTTAAARPAMNHPRTRRDLERTASDRASAGYIARERDLAAPLRDRAAEARDRQADEVDAEIDRSTAGLEADQRPASEDHTPSRAGSTARRRGRPQSASHRVRRLEIAPKLPATGFRPLTIVLAQQPSVTPPRESPGAELRHPGLAAVSGDRPCPPAEWPLIVAYVNLDRLPLPTTPMIKTPGTIWSNTSLG